MTGSLIQLYAITKHNKYLTCSNPETSNFKYIFKRTNHYAFEYIDIEPNASAYFGNKVEFIIPKKSHFIQECILKVKLPELTLPSGSTYINWTNSIGHALIDKIELLIGDYIVDTHDGLIYEILDELTDKKNYEKTNSLIRKYESPVLLTSATQVPAEFIYIPLKFWFNEKLSKALPIYLLKYHTIKVNVYFKNFIDCVIFDGVTEPSKSEILVCNLITKYIYMSDTEIQFMEAVEQLNAREYVIHQIQNIKDPLALNSNNEVNISLNRINHPVLEMLLVFIDSNSISNNDYFNFGKRTIAPYTDKIPIVSEMKFNIDGNELYPYREESFYRKVLNYNHHSTVPDKLIYTFPFCQNPENMDEYSGSLNFSAIDSPELYLRLSSNINQSSCFMYFVNYNIINIKNGVLGIQFIC